jgi:hypothetical protein
MVSLYTLYANTEIWRTCLTVLATTATFFAFFCRHVEDASDQPRNTLELRSAAKVSRALREIVVKMQ